MKPAGQLIGRVTASACVALHAEARLWPALVLGALVLGAFGLGRARADPGAFVPLGADALIAGRPTEGLLVLHSGYRNSPFIDADALVWLGADQDGSEGDVLVVSVHLREPHGYHEARLGRFVLSTGAVRPVHIDGISMLARAKAGSTLELFAGLPVVPELAARDFDWLAGGRAGQWLFEQRLGAGVSYIQSRDAGQLADEEVGADLTAVPARWLTLHALGAWDLVYQGLTEARVTASAQRERDRLELFAARLVAARMLPATSLFSVIGATPSSEAGGTLLWNAFPRLDLGSTLALEALDDQLGYRAVLRTTLRFSDEQAGQLDVEGTRRELGDEGWTGVLLTTEWPVTRALRAHGSFELVAADDPGDRGAFWPWARVGASYRFGPHWLVAGAVGAKATPEIERELHALLRVSYNAEVQP